MKKKVTIKEIEQYPMFKLFTPTREQTRTMWQNANKKRPYHKSRSLDTFNLLTNEPTKVNYKVVERKSAKARKEYAKLFPETTKTTIIVVKQNQHQ